MRLNQFLAQSTGVSRREADKLIAAGHVRVNNKLGEVGQEVHTVMDTVLFKGQPCRLFRRKYIMFNKPKGLISTRKDPEERKTIYDVLPEEYHNLRSAGRLDRQTSGLLILSDDGEFLNQLIHPSHQWAKQYRVKLDRSIKSADLMGIQTGVMLQPEEKLVVHTIIEQRDELTFVLSTKTGYTRQIRRVFESFGYDVKDLKRLSVGPLKLGALKTGEIRPLTMTERNLVTRSVSTKDKEKSADATPDKNSKSQQSRHQSKPKTAKFKQNNARKSTSSKPR